MSVQAFPFNATHTVLENLTKCRIGIFRLNTNERNVCFPHVVLFLARKFKLTQLASLAKLSNETFGVIFKHCGSVGVEAFWIEWCFLHRKKKAKTTRKHETTTHAKQTFLSMFLPKVDRGAYP